MSAWPEAKWTVDEITKNTGVNQVTGIPPKNVPSFNVLGRDSEIIVNCTPPQDTVIENQLVCTVKGVKIVRKIGSAPTGPDDGTLVADIPAGQTYSGTDAGLVNGLTYYYAAFPYSDHNVYNFNSANVREAEPRPIKYWAFDQDFSNLDPDATISYPTGYENSNFSRMLTNSSTGTVTAGGWLDFLQNTLKNYPYAVKKSGQIDYAVNPLDYTKKVDGTASDWNNQSYKSIGGFFAWLNKIYMKETYASDGESRRVVFADGPADGYTPVGFINPDGSEMEGIWIPMGYLDTGNNVLVTGTANLGGRTTAQEKTAIDTFGSQAVFFGGPIMNVIRDLLYMMFRSTDIQKQAGAGNYLANASAAVATTYSDAMKNPTVPGFYGTASSANAINIYLHSLCLGTYDVWLRDPYTVLVNGQMKVSTKYLYDPTGAAYENAGVAYGTSSAWQYPSHLVKVSDEFGSVPKYENTASTTTGLADGIYGNASGTRVALRLGRRGHGGHVGPACLVLNNEASDSYWYCGVSLMLLPPVGYAPDRA